MNSALPSAGNHETAYVESVVEEVIAGHNNINDWGSGWSGSLVTAETAYTNINTPPFRKTVYADDAGMIVSEATSGTAPLSVSSTTKVTNLNADLLDGLNSSSFAAASGSANYIQNTTSPQTANMYITGSARVGSLRSDGDITIQAGSGINSTDASIRFHTDKASDGTYEWLGLYSGATRQGIILYDGVWSGCRSISYEVCIRAENANDLTLVSDWDVYLWAKGANGDIHLNAGSGQILAVNNGTNSNPAYSFTTNSGAGMWITNNSELALGTGSTARLLLDNTSAQIWMGTTQRAQRMCHNRGDAPASAGLATIGDCSSGGSDFAEYYGSPGNVPLGTIVQYDEAKPISYMTDPTDPSRMANKAYVKTATTRSKSLGVHSTNPYVDVLGKEYYTAADNIIPIGLAGRVPVRVNTSNGPIAVGDPIALSTTPGVGAKAVSPGQIVGYAMEAYSGTGEGQVVALVSTGYWAPTDADMLQAQSATFETLTINGSATIKTLTVTDNVQFQGDLKVAGTIETATLRVNGHIIGNSDTRGEITIAAGDTEASVTFVTPYAQKPFMVASPVSSSALYHLSVTKDGFKVILDKTLTEPITFNYMVQE